MGGRGGNEGEDRRIKGENNSAGSGISIAASSADIIDCIRGSFVNHLLPPFWGLLNSTATQDSEPECGCVRARVCCAGRSLAEYLVGLFH